MKEKSDDDKILCHRYGGWSYFSSFHPVISNYKIPWSDDQWKVRVEQISLDPVKSICDPLKVQRKPSAEPQSTLFSDNKFVL